MRRILYIKSQHFLLKLLGVIIIFLCLGCDESRKTGEVPEIAPGIPNGYLPNVILVDSPLLLPPPPHGALLRYSRDQRISEENLALRDTPRWNMATSDADLTLPHAAGTFSCALDAPITQEDTPRLYLLLQRVAMDACKASYLVKELYMRPRPFMVNDKPTCTPNEEDILRQDGSYPSGHTALGWACASVLSQIAPEKSHALFSRAKTFAQSRVVCNVHWQSDVEQGRKLGEITAAWLQGSVKFQEDLKAAKAELEAAWDEGLPPVRDCELEADLLDG